MLEIYYIITASYIIIKTYNLLGLVNKCICHGPYIVEKCIKTIYLK